MTFAGARLIAFVGIAVCAGIISSFVTFLVLGGLPRNDVVMGVVLSVLAGAVLAVSLNATLRVERNGGTGAFVLLARIVPVLILIGAAAGVWFAMGVHEKRKRYDEDRAVRLCEFPAFWTLAPDACLEAARGCVKQRETRASVEAVTEFTRELTARLSAASVRERAHQEDPDPATTRYVDRLSSDFFGSIARERTQSEFICMAAHRR